MPAAAHSLPYGFDSSQPLDELMTDHLSKDDVRLPAVAVRSLAVAAQTSGAEVAAAVRDAGRSAGEALARSLARSISFARLDADDFWSAVNAETAPRGLGTFEWQRGIGGHSQLIARGSVEQGSETQGTGDPEEHPFTEGLLEGLLGGAAEEVVGVLPVPSDGGEGTRFLIGAPVLLRHVRLRLGAGLLLDEALEDL